MGHDVEAYNVTVGHLSPAQTKAAELAAQNNARNAYQRAGRNETREYEKLTGQPDGLVPVITSISPTTKAAGTGNFVLTIVGTNLNEDTIAFFGASELSTVLRDSRTELGADVPGTLITGASTVQVTIKTDGSVSNAKPFTIT